MNELKTNHSPPLLEIIDLDGKDGQVLKKLELRKFSEDEYHAFFQGYQSDPMMGNNQFVYNKEQISRSYAYNHDKNREDYAHYGIFLDGIPIGSFQLKRIDRAKKCCEFGIILQNNDVKNCGIGTEAIRLGMKEAHDLFHMEKIYGDTMKRNLRMQRVFDKLDFHLIEVIPDAFELSDGSKEDRLVYEKTLK